MTTTLLFNDNHGRMFGAACRNFFELVRFDFVVNEDMRVFLMEV